MLRVYIFYFQAMQCQIAGVVPAGGNWSIECCMAVRQLLASKITTVKLIETLENGYVHAVDILLYQGQLKTPLNMESVLKMLKCENHLKLFFWLVF